jgi:hypothetical protein
LKTKEWLRGATCTCVLKQWAVGPRMKVGMQLVVIFVLVEDLMVELDPNH